MTRIVYRTDGANAQRMLIAGRAGTGKTTLARDLARRARRAAWVDPKGLNEAGWTHVVRADRFADLAGAGARAGLLRRLLEEHTRIVVQLADRPDYAPKNPEQADTIQVDAIAQAAYALGNVLFVLDDLQGVYSSAPSFYARRVLTMGRSRGVGAMGIVTSVYNLPLEFIRQTNHIVAFAQHLEEDVRRLAAVRPDFAAVAELEGHGYIWGDLDAGIVEEFEPLHPSTARV
jgi:hypothetical protein